MEKELIEKLADIEHQRWSDWQKWVHANFKKEEIGPGSWVWYMPYPLIEQWQRQIETSYSELSEKEKESDREQVRRYLPLIREKIQEDLLIKCECEDGGCPNCLRLCKLIDELNL